SDYNPDPFIYLQRGDVRWNTGVIGHIDLNDYVQPYFTATYMNDQTTEIVGPSAAFQTSYPYTPDNYYRTNCSNPLLSAQERGILCTPAEVTADTANPGSELAVFDLGRRNIEGGGRVAYWEHQNFRIAVGSKGNFLDAFSYDVYGQYYYTSLFNSNDDYLNYQ